MIWKEFLKPTTSKVVLFLLITLPLIFSFINSLSPAFFGTHPLEMPAIINIFNSIVGNLFIPFILFFFALVFLRIFSFPNIFAGFLGGSDSVGLLGFVPTLIITAVFYLCYSYLVSCFLLFIVNKIRNKYFLKSPIV